MRDSPAPAAAVRARVGVEDQGGAIGMWGVEDMPDQEGRIAVITGASAGIGFETAKALAERGAHVVLAVRDRDRGAAAAARIDGSTALVRLDLAALAEVRRSAEEIARRYPRVDILINNAATWSERPVRTGDGFELQFATNHLGHFALTGLLLPMMIRVPGSRVVTVSSLSHRNARGDLLEFHLNAYRPNIAYARSKLANLLFAFELDRRLSTSGAQTISLAAHPGAARTELFRAANRSFRFVADTLGRPFIQTAQRGALPTLRAATDPAARGGEFYGPAGRAQLGGAPTVVRASAAAYDQAARWRLWAESERLTGVEFSRILPPG